MEWVTFGPFLARTRFAFLNRLASSRRALILGDGDGRFTARLLRANPGIHIDAVDAAPPCSSISSPGPHADSRTRRADARHFQPPSPPYDLIVTHFFLDCLTTSEIQSLAATLHAATAPQALWLVSEFVVPPTLFGRLIAQPIIYALYRAFALLTGLSVRTLPNHHAALRLAGFTLKAPTPTPRRPPRQ